MIDLKILFYQMEEVIEDIINMESSFNDEGIGCSETPLLMQRTVSILWNFTLLFRIENFIDSSTHHTSEAKAVLSVNYSPFPSVACLLSRNITGKVSSVVGHSWFRWSE